MPGVVFLIVVPTANFERELNLDGCSQEAVVTAAAKPASLALTTGNNLNINHLESSNNNNNNNNNNNAVLRLEVELRDKNAPKYQRRFAGGGGGGGGGGIGTAGNRSLQKRAFDQQNKAVVPLEKVLEELLAKLEIEHVTWTTSKKGYFHQVVFPLQAGEPCETTLHCLTELGIGTTFNSSVSVLPCSVSYDALTNNPDDLIDSGDGEEELSKWNTFVESIKSKLTVKQVVDGVRAGGSLSFDYLLLIVTADSLAALGLVENNAPNITAAMLVSPLMGPVMSITFGAIISDRELIRVGFISLALGMFISCLFGFIFGLILGTTEMPWGSGDWPTEEMRGRGNARSLWMGILWALTSGTGVAVALLQGSAGPLIGVAISASLLPPVVNCGLFWALACIWLIYPGTRIPHLKGEAYNETSSYPFLYTNYLPTEFLINGIVSCLLTVINVICIFITAIIVLKIKEVSAPYTASPDLKRFWETDLRTVRKTNRSTMRRKGGPYDTIADDKFKEKLLTEYTKEPRDNELNSILEQVLREAEDDVTFKKVKRMSYSSNAAGELTQRFAKLAGLTKLHDSTNFSLTNSPQSGLSRFNSIRNSKKIDLQTLDKLVTNLLEQQQKGSTTKTNETTKGGRKTSFKLNRWRPTSRSAHNFNLNERNTNYATLYDKTNHNEMNGNNNDMAPQQHMPTIRESPINHNHHHNNNNNNNNRNNNNKNNDKESLTSMGIEVMPSARTVRTSWTNSLERTPGAVRNVLRNLATATSSGRNSVNDDEENLQLTQNFQP